MRVDTARFKSARNIKEINQIADQICEESRKDQVYLSDLIGNFQTAQESYPIMQALAEDKSPRYRLKVLCDEWGDPVKPGDVVRRKHKRPLKDREGVQILTSELNQWKSQGIYDQKRYYYTDYPVDNRGCITVTLEDAEYFIWNYGVHKKGHRISQHIDPTSGPTKKPDGSPGIVHYHRFMELEESDYEKLPILKTGK